MLISELIKILELCNPKEEFKIEIENQEVWLKNKVYKSCKECNGTGVLTYEITKPGSFSTGGDYADPITEDIEDECCFCKGSGSVEVEEWNYDVYCIGKQC